MWLPIARNNPKSYPENRDVTNFRGLNRLPKKNQGEAAEMHNISSEYPGCWSTRPPRELIATYASGTAFIIDSAGKHCVIDGTSFKYDGVTKGTVTAGPKSMCDFMGVILIMPDKKKYTVATDTFATWGTGATYPATGGIPAMDGIYSHSNRVWGFKGREIYASKHNNQEVWNQFSVDEEGISYPADDDSYFAKLTAVHGDIKDLCPAENHMCFTTGHSTWEVFGDRPINYDPRLVSANRGALCSNTMISIDGRIYMLSEDGVAAYAGSHPRPISYQLNERYVSGVAGTDGRRYYLSLYNGTEYNLYYYDTELSNPNISVWYREDDLRVIAFSQFGGHLYAMDNTGKVWKFNSGTETIEFSAETDQFNLGYLGNMTVPQVKVEAELFPDADLTVEMKVDAGEYFTIGEYSYEAPQATRNYITYTVPLRGERFQMRLSGHGKVILQTLVRNAIVGSDVQG